MPRWLEELTLGLSSSQGCVVHPLKRPQNHRPSPFRFSVTFTHEEVKFKEQNEGGKGPSDIFSSSFYAVIAYNETFGGYFF